MTKNDRFQVSFPVIHELLPPIDEDVICLKLPRAWFPYVQGYLGPLKANYPYAGEHAKENRDRALKFLELFDGCDVITDLRIQNSRLEAQFCGDDTWVLIGKISTIPTRYQNGQLQYDVDGDGSFDVTQYVNNQQNLYGPGLPVADDNDRICRASWILARAILDDWRDAIRAIKFAADGVLKAIAWLSSWLGYSAFPQTVQAIKDLTSETVLDWLGGSTQEPEVINKTAELLYCAIKECYPDNLNNLFDHIDLGAYEPAAIFDSDTRVVIWQNFGNLANLAYSIFQAEQNAYLALALAKASIELGIRNVGFFNPTQAMLEYALATAEHFDSRDCGMFPCSEWTYTFVGQELFDYWELFDPESNYAGVWESTEMMWHLGVIPNPDTEAGGYVIRTSLQLKNELVSPANIATAVVTFAESAPNSGDYMKWYCDNEDWALDPDKYVSYGQETAEYTLDKSFIRIRFDIAANPTFGEPAGNYIRPIQSITLNGIGPNPFL